jgi:hypothetical protein
MYDLLTRIVNWLSNGLKLNSRVQLLRDSFFSPLKIAVTTIPRKLNIAPYPYKNKFCKSRNRELAFYNINILKQLKGSKCSS